jgi:hypothetical protein
MQHAVEDTAFRAWLDDEGIVHAVPAPHRDVTLADAQAVLQLVGQLGPVRVRPTLVDSRGLKSMARDARRFFAGSQNAHTSALAVLVSSPASRAVGNFFLSISKPEYPTRLFDSEIDALRWLREFL